MKSSGVDLVILKDLDLVTEIDLQNLIEKEVHEGKKIEYKETLPGNSDRDKKEFLGDVSSFANESGGYIIYGISEDRNKGIPEEIKGLNISQS